MKRWLKEVINKNPDQLEKYLSGKDRLFGFFVGQVMKASQGKANPKQVNDILKSKLGKIIYPADAGFFISIYVINIDSVSAM